MASATDPLGLLGDYGDSDSGPDEASAPAAEAAAPPTQPPAVPTSLPLPDADALLDGMPDWSATADVGAVTETRTDPKGTKYNAVPLPNTLSQAAAAAERGPIQSPSRAQLRPSGGAPSGAPAAGSRAGGAPRARATPADGKRLLPPQLKRPNVTTEDLAAMGAKRRKQP